MDSDPVVNYFNLANNKEEIAESLRTSFIALQDVNLAIVTRSTVHVLAGSAEGVVGVATKFSVEERGRPSAVCWLNMDVLCVGFESGVVVCYLIQGSVLCEYQPGVESSVQALKCSTVELHAQGPGLWILYEDSFLVSIPLRSIFNRHTEGLVKLRFVECGQLNDFVFLNTDICYGVEVKNPDVSHTLLVSGANHCLSLYNVGGKLQFQHLGKLSGYVKDKIGVALTKTFSSFFGSSIMSTSEKSEKSKANDKSEEISLPSAVDFEDTKRRILRLSIDPRGKLVAAADSLGRVTLFDCRFHAIVRLWKGLRDARLAWTESYTAVRSTTAVVAAPGTVTTGLTGPSGTTVAKPMLALAIYGPQIGLLFLYAMRHGPCLRTIPVGMQGHISTLFVSNSRGQSMAKCGLFRVETSTNLLSLALVEPFGPGEAINLDAVNSRSGSAVVGVTPSPTPGIATQSPPMQSVQSPDLALQGNDSIDSSAEIKLLTRFESTLTALIERAAALKLQAMPSGQSSSPNLSRRQRDLFNNLSQTADWTLVSVEAQLLNAVQEVSSIATLALFIQMVDLTERVGCMSPINFQENEEHWSTGVLRFQERIDEIAALFRSAQSREIGLRRGSKTSPTISDDSKHTSFAASSDGGLVAFTPSFHRALYEIALKLFDCGGINSPMSQLRLELTVRLRLLACYETLIEINTSQASSDGANENAEMTSEMTAECRKNTLKAEPLCWIMRACSKRLAAELESHSSKEESTSQITPTSSAVLSSLRSVDSASLAGGSASTTPTSLGGAHLPIGRNSIAGMYNSPFFATPPDLHNSRKSVSGPVMPLLSQSPMGVTLEVTPFLSSELMAFSVFRAFIRRTGKGQLLNAEEIVDCISKDKRSTLLVDCLPQASEMSLRRETWRIHSSTVVQSLQFIFCPLFGDVFSLSSFHSVGQDLGLSGGICLGRTLPLVAMRFEKAPLIQLGHLLTKQLSSSPFQRWLRDALLTFEDEVRHEAANLLSRNRAQVAVIADAYPEGDENADDAANFSLWERSVSENSSLAEFSYIQQFLVRAMNLQNDADVSTLSYDAIVRTILFPALKELQRSSDLEAAMACASLTVDTLVTVSEQIERRSSGNRGLGGAIDEWKLLVRRLRTTLFLSSRCGVRKDRLPASTPLVDVPVTVENLDSGEASIYALLAADTLCFASKAEPACEHELRCQQVSNKRLTTPSTEEQANSSSRALLAWGADTDKRWRELLQVIEGDDPVEENTSTTGNLTPTVTARKGSNAPSVGSPSRFARKTPPPPPPAQEPKKIRRRRPLLLFFPYHNIVKVLGAYRSVTLVDKWRKKPHRMELLSLSAAHIANIPRKERSAVAYDICSTILWPVVVGLLRVEEDPSNRIDNDGDLKECLKSLESSELLEIFVKTVTEFLAFVELTPEEIGGDLSVNWGTPSLPLPKEGTWPSVADPFLSFVVSRWEKFIIHGHEVLRQYTSAILVLFLRSQCGLRGIRPSQLLGDIDDNPVFQLDFVDLDSSKLWNTSRFQQPETVQATCIPTPTSLRHPSLIVRRKSAQSTGNLSEIRLEFATQCFRRLELHQAPLVYQLTEAWGLSLDDVKLAHITTLLERGSVDEQVEELLPQVGNVALMIETMIACLRVRIGTAIARVDRIPQFAKLLAVMDPAAVAWARSSVNQVDNSVVESIMQGKQPPLGLNLPATRHLVIRVQSYLLSTPSAGGRDGRWIDRKEKCDALLSLCSQLGQQPSFRQ